MKIKKINQKGFSHHVILGVLVVGIIALIGVRVAITSHAASRPSISLPILGGSTSKTTTTSSVNLTPMLQGIESPTKATASIYAAKDSAGNTMDSLKIIANPAGGYLGVYHNINPTSGVGTVRLATSTDLLHWKFVTNLDTSASQPSIIATSDGGFVLADEYNNQVNSGAEVRISHYPSLAALETNKFDKQVTEKRTLSSLNEGTPNIYSVTLSPNISRSTISIGFHYYNSSGLDRQAQGTLTNFSIWQASVQNNINNAITNAAKNIGVTIGGNIGDRDDVIYHGNTYNLQEVQYTKNNWFTWHIYFYNFSTNTAQPLTITTTKGSTSFSNPHFTLLNAPNGTPSMVVTLFIPSQGSGAGEAGTLIYYFPLS